MQITKNKVVQFHYSLRDADGKEIENSRRGEPMAYLHGHQNMLAGLEKAMEGRSAGDTFSVTLAPEDAYGKRVEGSEQRVPVKHLQGAKKWRPGMVAQVQTEQGARQVQVVKVGKFMVTIDTNHPLAGKTVTFDVEVLEVRDASAEELDHGHAHGVGGHHH
ncbi:peptidyl-prolyl cis-trans isomerase [Marinobacterium nitratireducens]|uniref:Peptidyl-prolyl cis-trans isomerase n=1 Tax=Marinobacterium nitratireducens TaxID=518897 RepID=A0A917Z5V8_9GAMM|nr:peptidylprolyl isomerase [Marinobacterium nitratireducens]GGO75625.1 peptidyl-prolyl cis-trans isomerase [Marinobacterium nitratireducens]